MESFSVVFKIVQSVNCPLYKAGDYFQLTARSLRIPEKKEACLILAREMTAILLKLDAEQNDEITSDTNQEIFSCSGCEGLIKFRISSNSSLKETEKEKAVLHPSKYELLERIKDCTIFQSISPDHMLDVIDHFQEETIVAGSNLTIKGIETKDLFVILSGTFSVDDNHVHIATLGPGDICGEMSYLAGNVASATVSAITEAVVVIINRKYFSKIMENSPSVQLYMAQLLAERLASVNSARANELNSCMKGNLNEMAPSELFQILHLHQKTGVLTLNFLQEKAEVFFRDGCIINATYFELENQEAIFKILTEKEGVYAFNTGLSPQQMKTAKVGDFMSLLMEGVRRIDEANVASNTK